MSDETGSEGTTFDEYISDYLLINFDAYLRGTKMDRKGEMVLTFGVPQHYRRDEETQRALADLMEWGGFSFSVILTRERPKNIPTIDVEVEDE